MAPETRHAYTYCREERSIYPFSTQRLDWQPQLGQCTPHARAHARRFPPPIIHIPCVAGADTRSAAATAAQNAALDSAPPSTWLLLDDSDRSSNNDAPTGASHNASHKASRNASHTASRTASRKASRSASRGASQGDPRADAIDAKAAAATPSLASAAPTAERHAGWASHVKSIGSRVVGSPALAPKEASRAQSRKARHHDSQAGEERHALRLKSLDLIGKAAFSGLRAMRRGSSVPTDGAGIIRGGAARENADDQSRAQLHMSVSARTLPDGAALSRGDANVVSGNILFGASCARCLQCFNKSRAV
eukprot:5208346-Pleurochrysis_carterae.AAC.1